MGIIILVAFLGTRVEPTLSVAWIDLDLRKPVHAWLTANGLGRNVASWVAIGVSIRLAEYALGLGLGAIIGISARRKHWRTDALMLAGFYVSIQELEFYVSVPEFVYTSRQPMNYVFSIISAPCVLAGAWLGSRMSKSVEPGFCKNCEYDLTGNTSGVCPECGANIGKDEAAEVLPDQSPL